MLITLQDAGHIEGSHIGDYSQYYSATGVQASSQTYYDETTGQYYDPTTGQYYDYSAYYNQDGTQTQSEQHIFDG